MSAADNLVRFLSQKAPRANPGMRVSLSLRAADATGGQWTEVSDEFFADPAGAREAILALPVPDEPSVLRAEAWADGAVRAVDRLSGDWLCDYTVDRAPVFLGVADWTWSDDESARLWAERRPWLASWDSCPLGSLAMDFAGIAGVPLRLRQRAGLACGRALAERAGAAAPACRELIALAEGCVDHPKAENGRVPRRSRDFTSALDRLFVGLSGLSVEERVLAQSVLRLADLLTSRPASWTPRGEWKTAYHDTNHPLQCARCFQANLALAQIVRDIIPASLVLRGLALQGVGERRDEAPGVVE